MLKKTRAASGRGHSDSSISKASAEPEKLPASKKILEIISAVVAVLKGRVSLRYVKAIATASRLAMEEKL